MKTPRVLACCGGMVIVGGLERMILEVLRTIQERGGSVHCVINSWEPHRIQAAVEQIGAPWSTGSYRHQFERRPSNPARYLTFGWDILKTSAGLVRDAFRFKPTHVLVPELSTLIRNWPALALLKLRGVRIILALQNAPGPSSFYTHLWRRLAEPIVDWYVCSSADCQRRLLDHLVSPGKTRVVYNTSPRHGRNSEVVPRKPPTIIFVGQVIPPKGLDLLLDAVGLLVARGVDVALDVVGTMDGWEAPGYLGHRDSLVRRAHARDLAGHVRFLGWRDDVSDLLQAATIHCCPSRPEMFEGLPLVVLEAKAAGIPSVAFANGPFPELIEHTRTGWLCPELTAAALADGLEYCLREFARRATNADIIMASALPFSREAFREGWWGVFQDEAPAPPRYASPDRPTIKQLAQ
jgi:glycosyltransferase involved in cell wall biosynthesis